MFIQVTFSVVIHSIQFCVDSFHLVEYDTVNIGICRLNVLKVTPFIGSFIHCDLAISLVF